MSGYCLLLFSYTQSSPQLEQEEEEISPECDHIQRGWV